MLRPTKHSHPDRTLNNLAVILLAHLREIRVESYDSLRTVGRKHIPGAESLFLPAVNFLFLLGLVVYRPKTDAFEFVSRNEAL
jgi:hypothetical protein